MNELREKLKFHYEMELQNYNPSRISEQDMFADMMLRFTQSQPIKQEGEGDAVSLDSALDLLSKRYDRIKELEKENKDLNDYIKTHSSVYEKAKLAELQQKNERLQTELSFKIHYPCDAEITRYVSLQENCDKSYDLGYIDGAIWLRKKYGHNERRLQQAEEKIAELQKTIDKISEVYNDHIYKNMSWQKKGEYTRLIIKQSNETP